ncbi:STAS domain-containing protein [Streptomyces sp. NBC_01565]|nr:STAS domain-containing protein [Streptomyces sp. NBC_01565]
MVDTHLSYEYVSEYVTVVTFGGAVDVCSAAKVRNLLVDLVSHGRVFLVLDLSAVDHVDSTGTGVFVGGMKRVRAHNGLIALVVTEENVPNWLRLTGLTRVFPIFYTVDPAVEFLGREVPGAHG